MADTLIITFMARDRPGVVEQLAEIVTDNGGNWLESQMAQLDNTFAGVARVSVPSDNSMTLRGALTVLDEEGFQVTVRDAGEVKSPPAGATISFEIVGPDHPGIVHELTKTIASLGASVESMETGIEGAPVGGGTLFRAQTMVRLPEGVSEEDFQSALEESADAVHVDLDITDAD